MVIESNYDSAIFNISKIKPSYYFKGYDYKNADYIVNLKKKIDILKKYKEAQSIKDYWKDKFEEAYEYCLPNRESFYEESPGQKRTDKIFDETAVVGVQEFASRLQAGITPTFARWADFQAGTEMPPEQRPNINLKLDKITDYVFQILQQ